MTRTSPIDARVRDEVYRQFAANAGAPLVADIAAALSITVDDTRDALRRLADGRALALRTGSDEILMAHPFSAVPTGYRVYAQGRSWWANCAWDALGFAPMLGIDVRIEAACPDCQTPLEVEVVDGQLRDQSLRMHFALPPRRWWDDIVFT